MYLKRLTVPVLDSLYRRHVGKVVRKFIEFLRAVSKTDRELLFEIPFYLVNYQISKIFSLIGESDTTYQEGTEMPWIKCPEKDSGRKAPSAATRLDIIGSVDWTILTYAIENQTRRTYHPSAGNSQSDGCDPIKQQLFGNPTWLWFCVNGWEKGRDEKGQELIKAPVWIYWWVFWREKKDCRDEDRETEREQQSNRGETNCRNARTESFHLKLSTCGVRSLN